MNGSLELGFAALAGWSISLIHNMLCDKPQLEWRRVAVYRPMRIDVELVTGTAAFQPAQRSRTCVQGMRVLLRREPTIHDPSAVALCASSGRRIGALSSEVAEWVAPLLDSGKTAFEGEIWRLEGSVSRCVQRDAVGRLMLTRHELVPKTRSFWHTWLFGAVAAAVAVCEVFSLSRISRGNTVAQNCRGDLAT
jgi:hypothetical protein